MTDPRYTDPRLSDPVLRRDETVGGAWGWIAGLAVLALIGFIVVAGWNNNGTTANNGASAPIITGSSAPKAMPPSTTGSGSMSPTARPTSPLAPMPATPPADSSKQ